MTKHTTHQEVPLPLPVALGGPEKPFAEAVDEYAAAEHITLTETYERISAVTGNSPKGLSIRYYQRGGDVWRFSSAGW